MEDPFTYSPNLLLDAKCHPTKPKIACYTGNVTIYIRIKSLDYPQVSTPAFTDIAQHCIEFSSEYFRAALSAPH
jgi:hypothetical protein